MFTWKKDRANISDEEPTFHVRYIGCTDTYIPVGPGCTSRHVQKLWDNAPSERHLKRVAVKLGLGGIWLKGVPSQSKSGETDGAGEHTRSGLRQQNVGHGHLENGNIQEEEKGGKNVDKKVVRDRKGSGENFGDKKAKGKNGESLVRHFKMEDVSFCAADKSANDRIFCWISRCSRDAGSDGDGRVGPLEVHAVLCSTVDKAQAMAAVMSRAFQLAYKDWRAEQQREHRKQQQRKMSNTASDSSDLASNGGKVGCAEDEDNQNVLRNEETRTPESFSESGNGNVITPKVDTNEHSGCDDIKPRPMSTSSSSSSLSSAISQRSSVNSKNGSNRHQTCTPTEKITDSRQEICTG